MPHAIRVVLLAGLVLGLGTCGSSGSSHGGPPVPEVTRLLGPTWIEVGEPFTVHVAAAYARGIDAVEVSFEGRTSRFDARQETQVRVSTQIVPRVAALQPLEAVVLGADGVRGPVSRIDVAVAASDAVLGDGDLDELRRLARSPPYGVEYGAPSEPPDASYPGGLPGLDLEAIEWLAQPIAEVFGPWWKRWREAGGPEPFDWQAACGEGVDHVGPTGAVLSCWLDQHPNVAQRIVWETIDPLTGAVTALAYPDWSSSRKLDLSVAFWAAYVWLDHGLGLFLGDDPVDPPVNQIPLVDCAYVSTGLTDQAAWRLYLGTVAHSLALEIGGFVPWSVTGYEAADLETLFHSKYMFQAGRLTYDTYECPGGEVDFTGYTVDGPVIPAPATTTFEFLVDQDILRIDHWQTVGRLMTWARSHMLHIGGGRDARNMEAFYQYRGNAPASRLMTGTPYVDPDDPAHQNSPHSWSPSGCHGVAHFFRAVMRGANIPVRYFYVCGHGVPVFSTVGRTMSHGDDVYNLWSKVTPSYPARELLITTQHFDDLFLGAEGSCDNIGRRPYDLLVDRVPDELVELYCEDEANGLSHAQGAVYELLAEWYAVQTLESQGLWTTLAAKAAEPGGCGP